MNITKTKDRLVAFFVAYCLVCISGSIIHLIKAESEAGEKTYQNYETRLPQINRVAKLRALEKALETGPTTSAQYFQLLEIWEELDVTGTICAGRACRIYTPTQYELGTDLTLLLHKLQSHVDTITATEGGEATFIAARNAYTANEKNRFKIVRIPSDTSRFRLWLLYLYLGGALLTAVLHSLQKLEDGCSPVLELLSYKAWRRVTVWPWYVWRNEEVTLQEQVTLLFRVLSAMCMGGISLMGVGVAKVMAQGGKTDGETPSIISTSRADKSVNWHGTFVGTFETAYDGPYVGRRFHTGAVSSNSLTLSHSSGFFMGVWTSKALTNRFPGNFGDEIDGTLGWNKSIKGCNISFDFTVINGRPLRKVPAGDVGVGSLRMSKAFQATSKLTLEPAVAVRYSTPFKRGGLRKGWIFELGLNPAYSMRKWFNLVGQANLIRHTGPYGFKSGAHVYLSAGLQWKFGPWTFTAPSGKAMRPLTRSGDGQHPLANIGAQIAYAW